MNKITILILALFLVGCKCNYHAKRAVKLQDRANIHIGKLVSNGCSFDIDSVLNNRTISKVTMHDTVFRDVLVEVPSDALIFSQAVRCDSLGNVILDMERMLLKKPKFLKGETKIVNNVLTVECETDSLVKAIEMKDAIIATQNNTIENLKTKQIELKKQPKTSFWDGMKGFAIWLLVMLLIAFTWYILNKTIFKDK